MTVDSVDGNDVSAKLAYLNNQFTEEQMFTNKQLVNKRYSNVPNAFSIENNQVINDNIPGNNLYSLYKTDASYNEIIEPELDFNALKSVYDISDSIRTCIDAYMVNINGFGWELKAERDISEVEDKLFWRRSKKPIPADEVTEIKNEEGKAAVFFAGISLDTTWTKIQCLKICLKELFGNAYTEWERDVKGNLIGCTLRESTGIRMTKREKVFTEVDQWIKNPITLEYVFQPRLKRFKKFVQVNYGSNINLMHASPTMYFKEFGDPRIMNAYDGCYLMNDDGSYMKDIQEGYLSYLKENNVNFKEATEILHEKIEDPDDLDGYGIPRWVSLYPVLIGVRSSDLLNENLLKNKGIPDLVVICEGSKPGAMARQIEDNIKQNKDLGRYGSLLILEGESTKNSSGITNNPNFQAPSIRVQPLSQLLTKEGMFMNFADKCSERVAGVFRLPSLFVGKTSNVNRATAEVAKAVAEEQVFTPMRKEGDDIINNLIFPMMRIKYYKYKSKSSQIENTELRAKIATDMMRTGALMPRDGRVIAADLLKVELEDINEPFMEKPLVLSSANSVGDVNKKPLIVPGAPGNQNPEKPKGIDNNPNADMPMDEPPMDMGTQKNWIELESNDDSEVLNNIISLIEKQVGMKVEKAHIRYKEESIV